MKIDPKYYALPFLIAMTIYDILIVHGYFSTVGWVDIYKYHWATFGFLVPCLIAMFSLGLRSWRFAAYSFVGIYTGWLDFLWYIFLLWPFPEVWTWLPGEPTTAQLFARAIVGLFIAVILDVVVEYRKEARLIREERRAKFG